MSFTAKELIAIAKAEIGYKEKTSDANLDSKDANSGSGNHTKYARDLAAAGYYNGNKCGYAWCDVFVDWCFYMLTGKNATKAQELECQTGNLGAGCTYSAKYYKNQNRYDTTPKVGDQIFFQQNGSLVHTGIVSAVTSTTVSTIEGNSSDQVKEHTYKRTDSYIAGYGHPKYDEDSSASKSYWQNGDTGDTVKEIQQKLISLGYSCGSAGADGEFGSSTEAAVKKFQSANGLESDGIVGALTLAALNKVASSSQNSTTSASTSDTEKTIWDYLYKEIGNPYGVAGLMGNLYAESGLISTNLQNSYESSLGYTDATYTAAVDNGTYSNFINDSAGYGLCQWTYYTRKKALLNYAKTKGVSIGDLNMQLAFLIKELTESYSTVLATLKKASAVLEASNAVLFNFERPANSGSSVQSARASYGEKYYKKYATASTTTSSTSTASTSSSYPTVKYGSSGTYVKKLQQTLIAKGYSCGSSGADGKFGIGTKTAVKKFQTSKGLQADGICGPKTWAALGV
jgi:peptidoglycan hydrolase-like protein with peptidoglycan-binding domain